MTATPALSVLVVGHEPETPAAWFGEALVELGASLTVMRPYAGEVLPDDLEGYDGFVVLGGAADSWDDDAAPWLPATRELVRTAEQTGVPTLGICLGHQIAVGALGGEVGRNPAGTTIAVVPLGWLPEASDDPVLGPVTGARRAVHWNNDVAIRMPPGSQVLARSADGAVQAARLGEQVWGVQFHPEAGPEVLADWAELDGQEFRERGIDLDALLDDAARFEEELHEECRRLAAAFARLATSSARAVT